ncbi:MAG TPA: protein-glutamate O-methyltransferase CheR, partial [Polyangiaceae bacterium]
MSKLPITDLEFSHFQRFIYEAAGITLPSTKKALVAGRLAKRLEQCQLASYGAYFKLLASGRAPQEVQTAVDLLTTNETHFFREMKHFKLLFELALAARKRSQPFRVWSAASSTGEEVYSVAMVLADCLGEGAWDVLGSDISARVLARARLGHYPMERAEHVPPAYLKRFCLKGIEECAGSLLVQRNVQARVQFQQVNLNGELPRLGPFDVIFLRNVMIYFNDETKRQVVHRILSLLK